MTDEDLRIEDFLNQYEATYKVGWFTAIFRKQPLWNERLRIEKELSQFVIEKITNENDHEKLTAWRFKIRYICDSVRKHDSQFNRGGYTFFYTKHKYLQKMYDIYSVKNNHLLHKERLVSVYATKNEITTNSLLDIIA